MLHPNELEYESTEGMGFRVSIVAERAVGTSFEIFIKVTHLVVGWNGWRTVRDSVESGEDVGGLE